MPKIHEGILRSAGRRFAIVASRFNDSIGDRLVDGALDAIRRTGGAPDEVEIFRCPGAMEIPGLARRVVDSGRFDGVICIGVVIRGATPHFDLVVNQAVAGIAQIAASARAAVANGVLACETIEQAMERAGTKAGNRGSDAAMAAIEMADLYATIEGGSAQNSHSDAGGSTVAAAKNGGGAAGFKSPAKDNQGGRPKTAARAANGGGFRRR